MITSHGARVLTRLLAMLAAAVLTLALVSVTGSPAAATGATQPTLVSTVPAATTPNVTDGVVYALAQVGNWIVAGGSFTSVTQHGASASVTRSRLFAFDQTTGAVSTTFAPVVDGTVTTLAAGPVPNTVYVGGSFDNVNAAKSKSLALLNLSDGTAVDGFRVPTMNGVVNDLRLQNGRLWLVGSFTTLNGVAHAGIGTLSATTGALDPYVNVQLAGHHNYNGSGARGAVGGRALDINPAGTRAVLLGNFKTVNGAGHDQIAILDLGSSSATLDPGWNTTAFSARCSSGLFDSYVEDVDFSPDGSYFAIATTGSGTTTLNTDGTRSLCDSVTRWSGTATGANVRPTWVDYTGNDTIWTVTVTGTAVYGGGHARWINNPLGYDTAGAGAVPRPGIVALDPVNGLPFSWNPGRNPRGAGAYALLATAQGLYVGSDTDWVGDFTYKRQKIAFFPLAGGATPPSTTTAALPANLYLAGPLLGGSASNPAADTLAYRPVVGTTTAAQQPVATSGISWSTTRGAFVVGDSLYLPATDGNLYRAAFDGTSVGPPTVLDAYDDPAWKNVATGSHKETHETYQGVKSSYYSEIASITGQFYTGGRIYYTLAGQSSLYWRYFEPDDGIVGGTETALSGADFSNVAGMTLSGSTIYYAGRTDGQLHSLPFVGGRPGPTATTLMGASGIDWRARSLLLAGPADTVSSPPQAAATVSCTYVTCTYDASSSSDPGGTPTQWRWDFGDHTTATGVTVTHSYAGGGTRTVSLAVTDDRGLIDNWTGSAPAVARSTTTALACTPASVRVNATTTCTITTKDVSPAPATAPAGTVRLTTNGSATLSSATCALRAARSAGTSTCAIRYRPRSRGSGTHTLTGTYYGDNTHGGSRGTRRVSVLPLVPKVSLASTHLAGHPKKVVLGVRCTVTTCRGTVTLYRAHTIGRASYAVTAGHGRTVTVALTAYGKKLLKNASSRHPVRVSVRITVSGGATVTRSATVT